MPSFLQLFESTAKFLPKVEAHIGRKLPHTPLAAIKTELAEEIRRYGHEAIAVRLLHENRLLADLMKQQKEHRELLRRCGNDIFKYNPERSKSFGTFWKEKQGVLNSKSSPRDRELLADQIDWLAARQLIKTELDVVVTEPLCRT